MKKTKVLWIGDGGVATGFANVNQNIINNLPPDDYDIYHLAVNYRGDWTETKPWHKLYPAHLGGDYLGIFRIESMVEKIKPDLVFILNDLWVIKTYLDRLDPKMPIVAYFPIDAGPVQNSWLDSFSKLAAIVAYTNFGRNEILKINPHLTVHIIPHGIDTSQFFPIPIKEARIVKMRGTVMPDDWVVLNANRNQPRKRVDLTIKGFCEFAKDKPANVKLYLHMGLEDAGWRIDLMMDRYKQSNRLYITSPVLRPDNFVSIEVLNYIYNSCDAGINTSLGEGWGLTPWEMAACNRPQITPNNSASAELFADGRGLLMPVEPETITAPKILTEGSAPSVATVAESLEYAYTHPIEMKEMSEAMYTWLTRPEMSWKYVALQWDSLFKEILTGRGV